MESLGIVIQAWFQKFVGNHAVALLKNTTAIWDNLASVAGNIGEFQRVAVAAVRAEFEPLWCAMYKVVSTVLKAEMLSGGDISALKSAADSYIADIKRLVPFSEDKEPDVPLKRHSVDHLIWLAERLGTVGLFAESPYESIHKEFNRIEMRCWHIRNPEEKDATIRRQWLIRRSPEGRKAREEHRVAKFRRSEESQK